MSSCPVIVIKDHFFFLKIQCLKTLNWDSNLVHDILTPWLRKPTGRFCILSFKTWPWPGLTRSHLKDLSPYHFYRNLKVNVPGCMPLSLPWHLTGRKWTKDSGWGSKGNISWSFKSQTSILGQRPMPSELAETPLQKSRNRLKCFSRGWEQW